jgi:hypothetical protein
MDFNDHHETQNVLGTPVFHNVMLSVLSFEKDPQVTYSYHLVRFEVFTAVTMKNGVFWDVTPCGSCKNRRFGGTYSLLHQGDKIR